MSYLLDTNTCIRYLNGRSSSIARRLMAISPDEVCVCSIVKAELFFGAARSQNPARTFAVQRTFLAPLRSLPFDDQAAEHYAHIRSHLQALGTPIGPNDLLIAAIALANDVTLVSHNVREFSRIAGLRLEDWEEES
jgi:tRNA(fMet)-specific endonuclease VapC